MPKSSWRALFLLVLPLIANCGAYSTPSPIQAVPYSPRGHSSPPSRQLRAVSKKADLISRDQRIQRRFTADLRYAEAENQYGDSSAFVSSVQIKSEAPILVLEDIEQFLSHIRCTESTIELRFDSPKDAEATKHACHHENGAFAVTSHFTCNAEGERSIFKVHGLTVSEDGSSLVMEVTRTPFKEAFRTFEIEFGHTNEPHLFRRHDRVLRRESPSSATTESHAVQTVHTTSTRLHTLTSTITSAPNITAIPSLVVPSTAASTATSAVIDLSFQELDTTFPTIPNNPLSQLPFTIGCKNCTTHGFLVLSSGKFTFDFNVLDGDGGAFDIIQAGTIELQLNSFFAHVELSSQPSHSAAFQHSLFTAPVVGFVIPGIGQAGIVFEAVVAIEFAINGAVELTYGFDLETPTGSSIKVNFGNLTQSNMKGLVPTTTLLPFTFNTTDVSLSVTAAFRPTIPISFSFAQNTIGDLTAEVSVFLDLPSLSATISTLSNASTDAACNALNSTDSTLPATYNNTALPASTINDVLHNLGPLVLIEPAVGIDLVVGADFKAHLGKVALPPAQTALTVFATNFSLPTACLAAASGFSPATAVFAAATSSILAESAAAASASSVSASLAAAASASEKQKGQGTGAASPTASGSGGWVMKHDERDSDLAAGIFALWSLEFGVFRRGLRAWVYHGPGVCGRR
ncbi:uncharacterized protein BDZ99DRAFT_500259 [Mytilinidion resinicola]|uniref:DUF7029 domain-containing protein n=1 Tax=Mytilinidion resinicola TaxID=574789 RepID=A0A6A6YJ53_9PEZI|nr:uncharacterized protein BDZ99DRAFT_500259 [Mytilinidion resinicola]KAF2807985.1 hypothetical protein BDZ99DRAFT_500259 [Mytilinidion resinicola]